MKSALIQIIAAAAALATQTPAVGAEAAAEPTVTERGPYHRVLQRTVEEVLPNGSAISRVRSHVELATGMHYWKDGQWAESKEEIEIFEGGAVARQGQHQVIWAPNFRTAGAVDLLTPDGKRFRSHVLGLAFTDAATGQSALIAEAKDCIGEVAGNQVIYRDAFDEPSFQADVRYTYTIGGLSQEVLIRQAIPSPLDYGLDPARARLEVWTEFIEAPTPVKASTVLKAETDPMLAQGAAEPDLTDDALDFGNLRIGPGKGFPLESELGDFAREPVPVGKTWAQIPQGNAVRTFLIEKIDYGDVKEQLDALPKAAAVNKRSKELMQARVNTKPQRRQLLASLRAPAAKDPKGARPMRMAAATPTGKGFNFDYESLLVNTNNFTFKGDTTYFVRANVNLAGTTVLESAVIKFTNGSTAAKLVIQGPLDCRTDSYRPAIFTSKDDNTVGELIAGSTGNPNTNYYGYYLDITGNTNLMDLHHVHMRRGYYGVNMNSSSKLLLRHAQICGSFSAVTIMGGQATLRNVLIADCTYAYGGSDTGNVGEQVTYHRLGNLRSSSYSTKLTNSLLISVTNNVVYTGANVVNSLSDAGIFQTVGAASHYLAVNSPHRNAGTTNINPDLAKDLKKRTTYPPVVLSGYITNDTTLSPQAPRGTDTPDLGFAYNPLDFVLGGVVLTNATLTATSGVALGTYRHYYGYGIALFDGARLLCEGSPTNLNRIVAYNTVQEQATTNWSGIGPGVITYWNPMTVQPLTRFRFTEWSRPARDDQHFYGYAASGGTNDLIGCQIHGGYFTTMRPRLNVTNCLFNRAGVVADDDYGGNALAVIFQNNLFYGGGVYLIHYGADTWRFNDNLFAGTILTQDGAVTADYNGYTTNVTRLTPNGSHDVQLATDNVGFQKGALGQFYLPTNSQLINAGSTWATNVGLYHFTTATNNLKEGSSKVDISFHYVAVTNGVPFDTDGEGLGDYYEDQNGDGAVNVGELDYQSSDTDYDGNTDYAEIDFGTAPLDANSSFPTPLGAWFFDDTNFFGFQGQKTTICTNVHCITTTTNPALQVSTNVAACIRYRDVEPNGAANVNCRNGSVRIWIKPNWSSSSQGGSGPGANARIIELGAESPGATNGQWALCLNSTGTQIRFCTQGDGVATTNTTASISWINNQWHEVVLTYGPTTSALYIDGQLANTGSGVQHYPGPAVRKLDGFGIGADKGGGQQTKAQHDNLETYNYQLAAETIQADFASTAGVPVPCSYRYQADTLPSYTLSAVFTPEPATIGEQIRRSASATQQPGWAWRIPFGNCVFPDWTLVQWYGVLQQVNWSAPGSTPSSGMFAGSSQQPFTADFTVSASGTVTFSGSAVTGTPIAGLDGVSVSPTTFEFVALPTACLGHWRFNGHWASDEGQLPSTLVSADNVNGWNGGALSLQPSGKLVYPASRSANTPNIKRNYGSIRLWFKPTWTSASAGGSGPGTAGRLLEMSGTSAWSLRFDAGGTGNTIELLTTGSPHFSKPISWSAGTWHQIVAVYSRSMTALYIDGTKVGADGTGVIYSDNAVTSFNIGSDTSGGNSAKGWFDELETFNYPLSPADISGNYNAAIALDSDHDGWSNLTEANNGTDPQDPDTDSDGVPDPEDAFPLDPTKSDPVPAQNPGDTTPPVIQLLEPINVVPQ